MAEVNVYYDPMGNTLTVWFGDRSSEYLCEETGDEVILMKNQKGEVIGFEKLKGSIPPAPLDKGGADRRGELPLIRGVPIGGGSYP